jgi:hypothetical protein
MASRVAALLSHLDPDTFPCPDQLPSFVTTALEQQQMQMQNSGSKDADAKEKKMADDDDEEDEGDNSKSSGKGTCAKEACEKLLELWKVVVV